MISTIERVERVKRDNSVAQLRIGSDRHVVEIEGKIDCCAFKTVAIVIFTYFQYFYPMNNMT